MRPPREWLEEVQFYLQLKQGLEYSLFLAYAETHFTDSSLIADAPACIGLRNDGSMYLAFNYPQVHALPLAAAAELLKHELLHAVFGHLGQMSEELAAKYDTYTLLIAKDLVVNQHCDCNLFRSAGLAPVTIDDYDFPSDLTLEEYCHLLQVKGERGGTGNFDSEALSRVFSADRSEDTSWGEIVAQGLQERWLGPIVNEAGADIEMADLKMAGHLEAIRSEIEARGNKLSRGWNAAYAVSYVDRYMAESKIPWNQYLRRMASRAMRTVRIASKRRPSRRHPSYWGRVTRNGMYAMVAVDTSGSMVDEDLTKINPELTSLHRKGCTLDVIHCDAAVAKVEPYNVHKGLTEFVGRGGTDFSPVFQYIRGLPWHKRPSFLIFYTDGAGGCEDFLEEVKFPEQESSDRSEKTPDGLEVLWLLTKDGDEEWLRDSVPFGTIRRLE